MNKNNTISDYTIFVSKLNCIHTECSNRVTVLLEYLDCALATCNWISHYNSVAFTLILLCYSMDFL